jgi:4a-hydroxytetrahydrobiopterin dehydratase
MTRTLDDEEIHRLLRSLEGWAGDSASLHREYAFPDFPTAIRGVDEIAVVAEQMQHHPDIDVRWRTLHLTLSTHDAGGVTQLDVELAHRIAEIATALGAT